MYKYHQDPIIGSLYIVKISCCFFYIIAYLTLTFDLVIFTLGQLQHIIDINHLCNYHQYPITASWYIVETSTLQTYVFDLYLISYTELWSVPVIGFISREEISNEADCRVQFNNFSAYSKQFCSRPFEEIGTISMFSC